MKRSLIRSFLIVVMVAFCRSAGLAQAVAGMQNLPDPLVMNNGKKVTGPKQWRDRRKELIDLFTHEMYGVMPGRPANMTFKVFDLNKQALNGKATREQVTIYFNGKPDGPHMDMLLYLPNGSVGPVPVVLGLNFSGNHTVAPDTGIRISTSWMEKSGKGVVNNRATELSRGDTASGWDVNMTLQHGYGYATIYRGDIDPDYDDGFRNGVQSIYPGLEGRGDNFSTVGAWAWALSRALDYLETDKAVNAKKVAVFGFSRLGKAALWAGATDERFPVVISNESGAGGAKLFRHGMGENIKRLCTSFPHWFCANFRKYIDRDTILPFDQHMMMSLIAPRPLYIASAEEDKNSDPEGEFLGALAVSPVYRFLGKPGLPVMQLPPLGQPAVARVAYHIRPGKHNVLPYDWEQYMNFMDKYFR